MVSSSQRQKQPDFGKDTEKSNWNGNKYLKYLVFKNKII